MDDVKALGVDWRLQARIDKTGGKDVEIVLMAKFTKEEEGN